MNSRITTTQSCVVHNTEGNYFPEPVCSSPKDVLPSHRVLIQAPNPTTERAERHYLLQVKTIQKVIKDETTSFTGLNTCGIIFGFLVSLAASVFCILGINGRLFLHLGCEKTRDCSKLQQITFFILLSIVLLELLFIFVHISGIIAIKTRSIKLLKFSCVLYLVCFVLSIFTANLCSCVMFGILYVQADKLKLMLKELGEYQEHVADLNLI